MNYEIYMRPTPKSINGLIDLINYTNLNNIIMVEIGSFSGESTLAFLKSNKVSTIYCIDPWKDNWSPIAIKSKYNMSEVEKTFDNRFITDSRVIKHKGTIDTFVNEYANKLYNIDLVYLDGNHSYEFVKHDISITIDKIHPKFISGHDYDPKSDYLKGVLKAVNEFYSQPDKIFSDTSWIKKIK